MGHVQLRHIRTHLHEHVAACLDTSDLHGSGPPQDGHLLSRAVAAFALSEAADIPIEVAATAVTDGGDDNGIDALFYDSAARRLYLVQSKWIENGTGSISLGELEKTLTGLEDILTLRLERFNERIQAKEDQIRAALHDAATQLLLVLAYTGSQELSPHVQTRLTTALQEINDTSQYVTVQTWRQQELHQAVVRHYEDAPIEADLTLFDWGRIEEPYESYYGQIEAADIANLYASSTTRLFQKNIRRLLQSSAVNETIQDTIRTQPEHFWYFNNGITALCTSIKKKPAGGNRRDSGTFECRGLTVVNGAQTVGSIAAAATASGNVHQARVMIRLINLEKCPPGFDKQITKATNTQNRVEFRDFAALDPEQERLQRDLALDGIDYLLKRGETATSARSCTLEDATIALACAHSDIAFSTQAKGAVGRFWEATDSEPYTRLFNAGLSATRLWRATIVLRTVDRVLGQARENLAGRDAFVLVHANRFILHRVFRNLGADILDAQEIPEEKLENSARAIAEDEVAVTLRLMSNEFRNAYPTPFFKNATRCRELSNAVDRARRSPGVAAVAQVERPSSTSQSPRPRAPRNLFEF